MSRRVNSRRIDLLDGPRAEAQAAQVQPQYAARPGPRRPGAAWAAGADRPRRGRCAAWPGRRRCGRCAEIAGRRGAAIRASRRAGAGAWRTGTLGPTRRRGRRWPGRRQLASASGAPPRLAALAVPGRADTAWRLGRRPASRPPAPPPGRSNGPRVRFAGAEQVDGEHFRIGVSGGFQHGDETAMVLGKGGAIEVKQDGFADAVVIGFDLAMFARCWCRGAAGRSEAGPASCVPRRPRRRDTHRPGRAAGSPRRRLPAADALRRVSGGCPRPQHLAERDVAGRLGGPIRPRRSALNVLHQLVDEERIAARLPGDDVGPRRGRLVVGIEQGQRQLAPLFQRQGIDRLNRAAGDRPTRVPCRGAQAGIAGRIFAAIDTAASNRAGGSGGRSRSASRAALSSSPHCKSSMARTSGRRSPSRANSSRRAARARRRDFVRVGHLTARRGALATASRRRSTGNTRASDTRSRGHSASASRAGSSSK